ncbi:MAG: type II secretion system protein [Acidimicrobiia bacterium]
MLKHLRKSEDFGQKNLFEKGFTLVELLVVIVILGILAAVVVFAVGGSTDKAQKSSCAAEHSAVASAVEAYRASVGSYPGSIDSLTSGGDKFLRDAPSWYGTSGGGTLTYANDGATKCAAVTP